MEYLIIAGIFFGVAALVWALIKMSQGKAVSDVKAKDAQGRAETYRRFLAGLKRTASMQTARENAARRRRERDDRR